MSDKSKAILAEMSHKIYQQFLCLVFKDKYNASKNEKIILYCMLHKAISINQVRVLFNDNYFDDNGVTMMLHRLSLKKYLKKILINVPKAYCITPAGLNECKRLIQSMHEAPLNEIKFEHEYYTFSLEDIVDELIWRCKNNNPVYWPHYLAVRDIYLYLLKCVNSVGKFEYETEASISNTGVIQTIYSKIYLGINLKYAIRSDGLLKYYVNRDFSYLQFFVELDTGSQSSILLLDKVQRYITNYVETRCYMPDTSLVFSINTASSNNAKRRLDKGKISAENYYYANTLHCINEMAEALGCNINQYSTIGDILSQIETIQEEHKGDYEMEGLKQLVKYVKGKPNLFIQTSNVRSLIDQYNKDCEEDSVREKHMDTELHRNQYLRRKELLKRTIIDVPMVKVALMRGFSIYTVANFDLARTLGYIHPELLNLYHRIRSMLEKVNLVSISEEPEYKLHIKASNGMLFRNAYYFNQSRVSIIVENISDDIGGYYRIFNLLEEDSIPSVFISTKVICLCDYHSVVEIKTKYLMTKQGKKLADHCSERINYGFDVLFATYEDISKADYFFSFSSDGKIVKKTMREML